MCMNKCYYHCTPSSFAINTQYITFNSIEWHIFFALFTMLRSYKTQRYSCPDSRLSKMGMAPCRGVHTLLRESAEIRGQFHASLSRNIFIEQKSCRFASLLDVVLKFFSNAIGLPIDFSL